MKYLDGQFYVEVKDRQFRIHPSKNIISRLRHPSESLRTQYQVQNETQIRKNHKGIKNDNNELEVKNYPKKQPILQQQKFKSPKCPSCKRNKWLEFDKGYYCQNCENNINKQKHQIDEKVRRQDRYFSTRLPCADKRIREIWMNMVNTTYNSTKDMINKSQEPKGKTKLKFFRIISSYYDERKHKNFQTQENPFSEGARGISKIYHEVLLMKSFLQTKLQFKNMNNTYRDLYYTVIKNRDDKDIIDDKNENIENDYINFIDLITPNHYNVVSVDNHVSLVNEKNR